MAVLAAVASTEQVLFLHSTVTNDATALFTFEGSVLRGRVAEFEAAGAVYPPAALLRAEELAAYADFCGRNFAALLTGVLGAILMRFVPKPE